MQTQPACPHPVEENHETLVQILLDETGSMMNIAEQTVTKLREYINGFRGNPNVRFSLTTFNSATGPKLVFDAQPAQAVTDFDYKPAACTPLLDAVGSTIRRLENCLSRNHYSPRPTRILVVVFTDGYENDSKEWKLEDVRRLLDNKQKQDDWAVVYLGAGIDAWAGSSSWGGAYVGATSRSIGHGLGAVTQAFANLSQATRSYTAGATAQNTFWQGTNYEDGAEEDSRPETEGSDASSVG